jgi:RHS repeat-associated protein
LATNFIGLAVNLRFVYGADDQTPSFLIQGANTYRLLSDERGSVRLVVNVADGSIVQQLDYDEFGRVLADSAPGFQPFGFAGGLYDPDTGLVRFGTRDYSTETGQWTARDPIGFSGGQFSLYAYVDNDPVNQADLSGRGPYGGGSEEGGVIDEVQRRGTMALNEANRKEIHRIHARKEPRSQLALPPGSEAGGVISEVQRIGFMALNEGVDVDARRRGTMALNEANRKEIHRIHAQTKHVLQLVLPEGGNLQCIGGDISGIGGPSTMSLPR